ncbi:hypothetical protein ABW19_dt0201886 [Dactylella cylindrospora]|nr:hypothetical protein ABW19_dt0201886 [Dactylella cylindrospora]
MASFTWYESDPTKQVYPEPKNYTITRCQAEELSQGGALWIVLVLAIGGAVHLPGSVSILGRKGVYRLSPELNIFEAASFLILVIRGVVQHGAHPKRSIQAALALRHFLGKGESWWLQDSDTFDDEEGSGEQEVSSADNGGNHGLISRPNESLSNIEKFELLDPVLRSLRTFSHARMLCFILTTLAFIKASVVSGTVRTFVLALSYYVPFLILELSILLLLEPPWPKSQTQLQAEALKVAKLMGKMDPFRDFIPERSSMIKWKGEPSPPHQRYSDFIFEKGTQVVGTPWGNDNYSTQPNLHVGFWAPIIIPSFLCMAMHIVWPISVPLFLVFDFQGLEVGKWAFVYLTWVPWVFWAFLCAGGVAAIGIAVYWVAYVYFNVNLKEYVKDIIPDNPPSWLVGANVPINLYIVAKFGLIVRFYFIDYTGVETKKLEWVDWLG